MSTARRRLTTPVVALMCLAAWGLTAAANPAQAQPAPRFAVTELAAPGGGVAINNRGDVVTLNTTTFEDDSSLVPYGGAAIALVGDTPASPSVVHALNAHGVSVGTYVSDGIFRHGATWTRTGVATDVRTYPGATFDDDSQLTDPVDINDSGALVGSAYDPTVGADVATRWSAAGVPTRVDPTGTGVQLTAINNPGVIAGSAAGHATLFGPGTQVRALQRLRGETASSAVGLTDAGVAFGYSSSTTGSGTVTTPVVWDRAGQVTRVLAPSGTTGALVAAGNARGALVGTAVRSNGDTVAVEWTSPTHPIVLPQQAQQDAPSLYRATGINDHGVITGSTVRNPGDGGYLVALVWTPRPTS